MQNSTYCIAEDILDRGAAPGDRISTSIMAVAFVGRTIFSVSAQVPLTNPLSNAVRRNFNSTNGSPEPNRRLLSVLCLRLSSLVRSHVLNGTTNPSTRCQSFSRYILLHPNSSRIMRHHLTTHERLDWTTEQHLVIGARAILHFFPTGRP